MGILEINELSMRFGEHEVLRGLDMDVPEHSIFGFVGQNGAGKTTTMKIILGLLKPNKGSIYVCGERVVYGDTKTNRNIGFLPDVPEFYGYMRPMEYLKLCGEITGMPKEQIKLRSEELLSLVGLNDEKKKIGGFSRGMKQRLGIAQALLNEPKLLICDEPTSALDPIGRKEILDILLEVKGKTTVVFSTHILSDVERICDRIAILHKGKVTLQGTLSEIKEQHINSGFLLEFSSKEEAFAFENMKELQQPTIHLSREGHSVSVIVADYNEGGHFLLDVLSHNRIVPYKFTALEPTLESLYMEAVQ